MHYCRGVATTAGVNQQAQQPFFETNFFTMKKSLILIVGLSVVSCVSQNEGAGATADVSLETMLDEMVSYDTPTSFPAIGFRAAQVSSYDRRTVSPDLPGWFANDDGAGFERLDTIDGRVEKVLFDEKGPGAVTRIWMTTKDKRGVLRFYFDGSETPGIEIPAYDMSRFPIPVGEALSLTHTHYENDIDKVGGNSFFLPLPYAESCRITFEEPDYTVKIPRYYHIGYRSYDEGTSVKTFTMKDANRLSKKIKETSDKLMSPKIYDAGTECTRTFTNYTAEEAMVFPEGDKAIRSLSISLSDSESASIEEIMRTTWLRIDFDGIRCVYVPLDCFFGAGTGTPATSNYYTSSDGKGYFTSRWVMPYDRSATLWLENKSSIPFKASVKAYVDDFTRTDNTLYFHATYIDEDSIPAGTDYDSPDNLDWNFTTINGKGIYCGDILSLNNHCPDWYGEGDEKIWVDDDNFPSFMGTGTEDYFNCSWAPVVPFETPFGGAPRADEASSHGYNTFSRTRNLDIIPFSQRLKFDLEILSWNPGSVDYRAAAFWYGTLEAKATEKQ